MYNVLVSKKGYSFIVPIKKLPSKFKNDTERLIMENYYTKTKKELCEITGLNLTGVDINFVVKKNGMELKFDFDTYKIKERKEEFIRLVEEGYTNKHIKELWGIDCDTALISHYRRLWGLQKSKNYQKLNPVIIKEIKRLYIEEEMGSGRIADKFGFNISTVQTLLREAGLLREPSERAKLQGKFVSGRNSVRWRGGHGKIRPSFSGEYNWTAKYKQSIRDRDDSICQLCYKTNYQELFDLRRSLCIHHIIPYRDIEDNPPWNLISLCISCHGRVESKYTIELVDSLNLIPDDQLVQSFVATFSKDSMIWGTD